MAPDLRFIVQGLENVVAGVKERVKERENLDRISFEVNGFFETQLLKNAEILRNVVQAIGSKSWVMFINGITPAPKAATNHEERKAKIMDMEMMICFNAAEEDLDGWKALLTKFDERLELQSVVRNRPVV